MQMLSKILGSEDEGDTYASYRDGPLSPVSYKSPSPGPRIKVPRQYSESIESGIAAYFSQPQPSGGPAVPFQGHMYFSEEAREYWSSPNSPVRRGPDPESLFVAGI